MGHGVAIDIAADAIKTYIRDVMLAAGIEAAADLDAEILDRLVELKALFT